MKLLLAGQSYTARNVAAAAQQSLNLYAETIEDQSGKSARILRGSPGLHVAANLNAHAGNVRGLWSGGGRCFAVIGAYLYELAPVAFTDLVIDGAVNTKVTSALNAFSAASVGLILTVTSGTGFTPGTYTVSSVAGAVATLSAAVGTVSSTGGIAVGYAIVASSTQALPTASDGNPVQIIGNGTQLGIVADGFFLIDNGADGRGIQKARFQLNGVVTAAGTAITWTGGDKFTAEIAGIDIYIANHILHVVSRSDSTHMTLASSLGGGTGTVSTFPGDSGKSDVFWVSGDQFDASFVGMPIVINTVSYKVEAVLSAYVLQLTTGDAGIQQAVAYSAVQTTLVYSAAAGDPVTALTGAYLDQSFYVQRPRSHPISYTDLVIDAAVNTHLTSAAHPFDSTSIGQAIVITAGTGFTPGTYTVLSVTGVIATMTAAVGTVASTGGIGIGYPAADLGRQVNFSAANGDGTIWNGLDFVTKEGYPDYIQCIFADREQLYIFGTESGEVNQNDLNTGRLIRIQGTMMREGNPARYGVVSMQEHLYFIGGSPNGAAVAYRVDGFTLTRISTHAVEEAWATNGQLISALRSWFYQDDGHLFWVICFPGSNAWAYDATEKYWHERADWTGSAFAGYRAEFHTYIPEWQSADGGLNGVHIVGDAGSAKLLVMSSQYYDDAGGDMKRIRALPYIYAGGGKRVYCDRVDLDMATGLIPSGTEPTVTIEWSEDNGHTFSTPEAAGFGTAGQYSKRVYWIAQGSSETSMMPRISITSQAAVTLIDAEAEVSLGTT